MTATLYTYGYQSGRILRILDELAMIQNPFPHVDVRSNPNVGRWDFRRENFCTRPGIAYRWIPELGNEYYEQSLKSKVPCIKITNMDAGIAILAGVLQEHGRAAIFCACYNRKRCHRELVAAAAKEQLGVQIVHL